MTFFIKKITGFIANFIGMAKKIFYLDNLLVSTTASKISWVKKDNQSLITA
ncbi:MAG: hypothetical protein ACOVQA_04450 [Thermoflexibacteraceae bacterium]|jgi:hypothetical protein